MLSLPGLSLMTGTNNTEVIECGRTPWTMKPVKHMAGRGQSLWVAFFGWCFVVIHTTSLVFLYHNCIMTSQHVFRKIFTFSYNCIMLWPQLFCLGHMHHQCWLVREFIVIDNWHLSRNQNGYYSAVSGKRIIWSLIVFSLALTIPTFCMW